MEKKREIEISEKIRRDASMWPNWKKQTYNDNFAISKHSEKLKLTPDTCRLIFNKCELCAKCNVCKNIDQYKNVVYNIFSSIPDRVPLTISVNCPEFLEPKTFRSTSISP
jgi:hypothetical protein